MPRGAPRSFLPTASAQDAAAEDTVLVDVQYGRTVTLPLPRSTTSFAPYSRFLAYADANYGVPVDVAWINFESAQHATVFIRSPVDVGNSSIVYVHVLASIGGATKFAKRFALQAGVPTSLRVFGKSISVSAYQVGDASQRALSVSAAILPEEVDPLAELVPMWTPSYAMSQWAFGALNGGVVTPRPGNDGPHGQTSVSGYFLGCSGHLHAGHGTIGSLYYIMFFDRNADVQIPISGDSDPLVTLGPLLQATVPPSFAFDRSLRPSVRFSLGLCWVISTTAIVYTPVADGCQAIVDADYGL